MPPLTKLPEALCFWVVCAFVLPCIRDRFSLPQKLKNVQRDQVILSTSMYNDAKIN